MKQIYKKIQDEVESFYEWSNSQVKEYEWDSMYPNWTRAYTYSVELFNNEDFNTWNDEIINNVLYLIARDNECEEISSNLVNYPELLLFLAKKGLHYNESDTRWQLAHYLGEIESASNDVELLLTEYYRDSNEYVMRRSLLALGNIKSKYAEQFAIISWNTGMEYQKIAALQVLNKINSVELIRFLELGENDKSEHVKSNVKNIRDSRGLNL
ncbi:HEAT repeat domain-containing protein [Paenibacillus sp. SYP-B3998]|uniref:HEAT repeat domain-containing protein n=1 Tax=Paenibacillus sp. SYP-B3998 TaxID=2678564 RepID=A0A6G4A7Z8_9BACL|nr:HEAT repeat domain-containing protein [Paenibacillus sp. SYP-B3998]NEW09929.1 HEAT repeat domain-containing protein [Paenibacillus sp. SYP-B3998]